VKKPIPTVDRPDRTPERLNLEYAATTGPGRLNDLGQGTRQHVESLRERYESHQVFALPADPDCKTGR